MKEEVQIVPIDKIVESKTNPRKTLDTQREKEIFESVKAKGIFAPLLVRPLNGNIEIVEGARRFRAAKAAGLASVPAIIRSYTDDEAFEIQLISFTQRVDIHPLDEAAAYEALRKKKFDIAQISAKVGKERSYIARRLQLVNLIDQAKKQYQEERITLGHALELARLDPAQQKEALEEMRYDISTVSELREFIQDNLLLNLDNCSFRKDDAALIPKAGPCTTCAKRSGNNPDLFGDISAKGNHCLDAACFGQKNRAWAEQKKEELAAEGKTVVDITDGFYAKKGSKAIGTKDYSVVDKKRANAYGIFIDGPEKGKLVPVKLAEHAGGRSSGNPHDTKVPVRHLSPAEMKQRYQRRLEIFEDKIEGETRNRLLKSLLMRMRWPLERKEFEVIVPDLFEKWGDRFRQYEIDMVAEATGIKLPGEGHAFTDKVIKLVRTLTDQQLVQLTFAVVLREELVYDATVGAPDDTKFKALLALAHYKNIHRAKVHAEVARELAPKKPKPPKVEEKKAKVKTSVKKSAKKAK